MRSTFIRRSGAAIAAAATAVALSTAMTPAHAATQRHALPDSKPAWLKQATSEGAVSSSKQMSFDVLLKMRNHAGAEALAQKLTTPGSAQYRKWLSSSQFRSQFAPAASTVSAVQGWLKGQGLTVDKTLKSGMLIEVHGSAATVEKAFDTALQVYKYRGHTVSANTTALSLPGNAQSSVLSGVDGIIGLDQASDIKTPADTLPGPPPGARYGVQPCSTFFGQKNATTLPAYNGQHPPYAVCGYTPSQLQSAYGVKAAMAKGYDGSGVTVAITDAFAAPTIAQDARAYNAVYNVPQFKSGQFQQITPGANGYDLVNECGGNGWYGEETLDVEAVHNMAPGANVTYVGAKDCSTGLDDAWASAIDSHIADVITNSWTDGIDDPSELGSSYIDFYDNFGLEAAVTGITVNFSSGDSGDHTGGGTNLGAKTAEFPADVPWVSGIGGTSVEIGQNGQWMDEHGWQSAYAASDGNGGWKPEAYSSGGGGGVSQIFPEPYYQKGVVPDSESNVNGNEMRVVPDISMDADPNTGMVVGETQAFPDGTYWDTYRIGGTSLASPLEAGVVAVLDDAVGGAIGFANPLYYQLSKSGVGIHDLVAPSSPIYQVRTDYTNGLDPSGGFTYKVQHIDVQTSTLHDMPGYDDETGVGSPNLAGLAGLMSTVKK